MAFALLPSAREPLSEINTTPLIDVLLVLLVVLILAIPLGTHSVDLPLPQGIVTPTPDPVKNKIVLTREGAIVWNGDHVSQGQLLSLLRQTRRMPVEPELQFEPEANASYDLAAKVLNAIKGSGVTQFGVVGNERYRAFSRGN